MTDTDTNRDTFVVIRVIRSRVGDTTYPTAVAAAQAADAWHALHPDRQYAIAHVTHPTDGQVES